MRPQGRDSSGGCGYRAISQTPTPCNLQDLALKGACLQLHRENRAGRVKKRGGKSSSWENVRASPEREGAQQQPLQLFLRVLINNTQP